MPFPKQKAKHLLKHQQGIALIQVLLISAILTVLALYLTATAKDQVKIAQWNDNKAEALVALHSAESELLFTLLVSSKLANKLKNTENTHTKNSEMTDKWNFFGKHFVINKTANQKVTIKIQDQSALIHAHFPHHRFLKALIVSLGHSEKEANSIFDNLLDWQDLDNIPRINGDEHITSLSSIRNGAVPDIHDFIFVKDVTAKLHQALIKNTTLYSKGFFNPMYAPKELLSAITSKEIAEQIIQLREHNQLTNSQFSQLTGIFESDNITFYPSNILSIDLEGQVGISVVRKNIIIELNPYANEYQSPINIFSNRG